MSGFKVILQREVVARVRSKAFVLSTILTPLFLLAVFLVPIILEVTERGEDRLLAVVDEAPGELGAEVVEALGGEPESESADRFELRHLRTPAGEARDSLNQLVLEGGIDGWVHLPPDLLQGGRVGYRAKSVTDFGRQEQLARVISEVVQGERLREAGLEVAEVSALLAPVPLAAARVTAGGEEGGGAVTGLLLALVLMFFLYFMIVMYGVQVMQSVQEEKTNRIAEVLVSSVRPTGLMLGKVMGVGLVALLQVAIWGACFGLLLWRVGWIGERVGIPPGALDQLTLGVSPWMAVSVTVYGLLGFFLYAALFAAAGAAAESAEDAQRFTFPLLAPLMVPLLAQPAIISNPEGTLATVLGWIPFTSPLVMPMRMGAGAEQPAEVIGSLLVLTAGVAGMGWVAGKVYRIGILSAGKRPSLGEIWRWVRTA